MNKKTAAQLLPAAQTLLQHFAPSTTLEQAVARLSKRANPSLPPVVDVTLTLTETGAAKLTLTNSGGNMRSPARYSIKAGAIELVSGETNLLVKGESQTFNIPANQVGEAPTLNFWAMGEISRDMNVPTKPAPPPVVDLTVIVGFEISEPLWNIEGDLIVTIKRTAQDMTEEAHIHVVPTLFNDDVSLKQGEIYILNMGKTLTEGSEVTVYVNRGEHTFVVPDKPVVETPEAEPVAVTQTPAEDPLGGDN